MARPTLLLIQAANGPDYLADTVAHALALQEHWEVTPQRQQGATSIASLRGSLNGVLRSYSLWLILYSLHYQPIATLHSCFVRLRRPCLRRLHN